MPNLLSCVSGGDDGEVGVGYLSANGDTCVLQDPRSGQAMASSSLPGGHVLLASIKYKIQE